MVKARVGLLDVEPCHPGRGDKALDCTCYSTEQLRKIADAVGVSSRGPRDGVWKRVDAYMRREHGCQRDWCWVSVPEVRALGDAELLKRTFRPRAPADWTIHGQKGAGGRYAWLSNFDIDAVLKQYNDAFPDRLFVKCTAIDFEQIGEPPADLCLLALKRRGVDKVGVVFNLDRHDQPGSHWTSLFFNTSTGVAAYFDSYGRLPEPQIQEFMARMVAEVQAGWDGMRAAPSEAVAMTPIYGRVRHQYRGSACGLYSLYWLIQASSSDGRRATLERILSETVDDETMTSFRERLFVDRGR